MNEPSVPSPLGANGQYDLLYRSYLNSEHRTRELGSEVSRALDEIRASIQQLELDQNMKSRVPFGRVIHWIFRKLLDRHLGPVVTAIKRSEIASATAIEKMCEIWDQAYRLEFEMERRSRSGVLDRLAVIDALQIRVELLEQDLARLRTSD